MSSNSAENPSTQTAATPISLELRTIDNGLFARVADLNVNDGRVVGLRLHGYDSQLLFTQPTGNGGPQDRAQIPVNSGIYTFTNEKFGKALDHFADTDGVIGFDPHGGNPQMWIFEQDGGGWTIRSQHNPGTYLGLCYDNSYSNGQEICCVDFSRRLVWEVQPAANNTVRIALHTKQRHIMSRRLRNKNLDLDKRTGSTNHTKVKLWEHLENATQQRWIMEYKGRSSLSPQTRANVPTGPVYIINNRHRNVVDSAWPGHDPVHGYELHGGKNQQWIFEPAGAGYAIATLAIDPPAVGELCYLGLSPNSSADSSRLIMVNQENRVIWTVQSAKDNTFRIARMDHPNWCLQMSEAGNGPAVVLFSHTANAIDQRWELKEPGTN